jgi:hypothetical protein
MAVAEKLATSKIKTQRRSFDLTNGRDEMNLAEFPLFYLGQRVPAGLKTLRYEHSVYDAARNRSHTRKLEIAGSDAYGLPTVRDADVLLALLLLAKQNTNFDSETVSFSLYELIEILGWDHSGTSYKRINESLRKWKAITLFFDNGWWDRENEQWRTEGFNILDHISINRATRKKGVPELRLSSCTFSKHFFTSLHSGNIKKLNLAEWFSLRIPAAKQMYRFLDKRFYKTSRLDFDLREFACEHVGLSRNYKPSKLKEKLKPAIEELVSIGFIADMAVGERYAKVSHGEWRINFIRTKRNVLATTLKGSKSERSAARLLIKDLTDRGMTPASAQKLVTDDSVLDDLIRSKIELLDWYLEERPDSAPKQKGGWLMKAIKEDYQPPSDFKSKAVRETEAAAIAKAKAERQAALERKQKREAEQRAKEDAEAAEKLASVMSYLATLSPEDHIRCIEEAIGNMVPMFQNKARQELKTDSDWFYVEMALLEYVPSLLDKVAVK